MIVHIFNENYSFFVSVKVKWGRESFPNISVNTDEEPILFKAQLFALTGVQPHRQKVMCKGVALKDDEWNFSLKDVCIRFFNLFSIVEYLSRLNTLMNLMKHLTFF